MNKFFALENLLKSGYCIIPRVILENQLSSCEKTALRASILGYFYQKAYFAKGDVVLDGRIYTCFRGELIANQEELAVFSQLLSWFSNITRGMMQYPLFSKFSIAKNLFIVSIFKRG